MPSDDWFLSLKVILQDIEAPTPIEDITGSSQSNQQGLVNARTPIRCNETYEDGQLDLASSLVDPDKRRIASHALSAKDSNRT